MLTLLPGLLLGAGLFLVYWSFWPRPVPAAAAEGQARRPSVEDRITDALVQAGYESIGARTLLTACVIAFVLVFLLFFLMTKVAAIAACFAAMAAWAPIALMRMRARRRRASLRDLWPDAVDNITSAVRAGLALPEALAQLAHRGPEDLRPAFADFAHDYRTTGRFNDCLDRLKDRLADPVGDRLIESLRIAREVGGSDLGLLLRTLSVFLREDARTRSELETRQSWTVNAARLAVAAPWIVLAMMSTRGDAVRAYSSGAGALVLAVGAAASIIAYRLMLWIGRLSEDRRVLR
ncbi:type II secretion system F family protein [Janibacter sp. G56]|uniref:type II secretion system F family protein n=1 Tax=Janibacter sp. G56 TaxID=3418717 RepID=UPI003D07CF7D